MEQDRKLAESKMNLRKNSQSILENLKKSIQIEKGIDGIKTISSELDAPIGDASKVDIHKKDEYGVSTDEDGFLFCDIATLQGHESREIIKKRALKEHKSEIYVRFDMCDFPESRMDRDFILSHKFRNLGPIKKALTEKWGFLSGDVGRGKTAVAIRTAWELIKDDYSKKATFIPIGPWVDAHMPRKGEITDFEMKSRNHLRGITGSDTGEVVILDDFDKFKTDSEFQSNHLFNLVDQLKNRNCKVLITSNRSIEEMEQDCHAKLLPVLDRIKGWSRVFNFKGKSYR